MMFSERAPILISIHINIAISTRSDPCRESDVHPQRVQYNLVPPYPTPTPL